MVVTQAVSYSRLNLLMGHQIVVCVLHPIEMAIAHTRQPSAAAIAAVATAIHVQDACGAL